MDTTKLMERIKEVTSLTVKCVGFALAIAVFVCSVLEIMQASEAVKLLSLAVALLGAGVLSDIHPSNEKKGGNHNEK